jgi:eukaryotic-like serine/threonine-protein kinase
MNAAERWARVKAVFDEVIAATADSRPALLRERCLEDSALQDEVERLLLADAERGAMLEGKAGTALLAHALAGAPALVGGHRFGPYDVIALLGAGGMGEVYRARDRALGRDVAIKILPRYWMGDPDRRSRFEQEARLLATVNHPNIGAIYGVEAHEGIPGLVLELVDGETLGERIARQSTRAGGSRGLTLPDALGIAVQIARALEAAHERGIVHCDLKPTNIRVTPDGLVKVLDFGVAKAAGEQEAVGDVLGTAPYMSPEQARGDLVDRRADIWAFGCVLYEMLTGGQAFDAVAAPSAAGRVRQAVDLARLPPETPAAIRRLLTRCLDEDRTNRLDHVAIARFQIEEVLSAPAEYHTTPPARRQFLQRLALGLSLSVASAVTWRAARRRPEGGRVTRLLTTVAPADQVGGDDGRPRRTALALSPDGRALVFTGERDGRRRLYLRRFEDEEAVPIAGTEGAMNPLFSPDGRWIAFWAGGQIRKVPREGGPPARVADVENMFGASWGDDDRIVFARITGGLLEVPAGGGTARALTAIDRASGELSHRLPHTMPGSDAILYTVTRHRFPRWDQTQIAVYSRRTGRSKTLPIEGADARYVPTGHLIFAREGSLLAVPFDLRRLDVTGGAVTVAADVMQSVYFRGVGLDSGAAQVAVSAAGTLAYLTGGVYRPADRVLLSVDRRGTQAVLPLAPRAYATLRLSPDGGTIALSTFGSEREIWLYARDNGMASRLAIPGRNAFPVWTPDGSRITYAAGGRGPDALYWVRSDGLGPPELLVESDRSLVPAVWTPDGRRLLYYQMAGVTEGPPGVHGVFDIATSHPPEIVITADSTRRGGYDVSPNGRWLAYQSPGHEGTDVYVQAYPEGRRYLVAVNGLSPIWRADGREIVYLSPLDPSVELGTHELRLMAVPVASEPTFTFGTPRELFRGHFEIDRPPRSYDVTPDGRQFFFIQARERAPDVVTTIHVVERWFEDLERLAPVR